MRVTDRCAYRKGRWWPKSEIGVEFKKIGNIEIWKILDTFWIGNKSFDFFWSSAFAVGVGVSANNK